MKVYWVSRHEMSPAQVQAMKDLHGREVEIIQDPVTLEGQRGLAEYIRGHSDGFVYAVASNVHLVTAALENLRFGVFENHHGGRAQGIFSLAAVYHFENQKIDMVWENPDPESDEGESLTP